MSPATPGDPFRLFVYGTLMHDGRNHAPLRDQRFLGTALTTPHYVLLVVRDHPGMIRVMEGGRRVVGELYEVAASVLALLDEIEEAPDYFRLEPIEIEGASGPVFAYIFQQEPRQRVLYNEPRWHNR
jgi:gamma-glutamylcyclotransferase (GGCT)/AIG2-like uncharacterized protein YtfP